MVLGAETKAAVVPTGTAHTGGPAAAGLAGVVREWADQAARPTDSVAAANSIHSTSLPMHTFNGRIVRAKAPISLSYAPACSPQQFRATTVAAIPRGSYHICSAYSRLSSAALGAGTKAAEVPAAGT